MKARIFAIPALLSLSAALSAAADPQLLGLVMSDAQIVAGINVEQAKTTPFGQYVLSLVEPQDPNLQKMVTQTGFDPRRDVRELLVASPGGGDPRTGIAAARGNFDVAKISAAALAAGATVQRHGTATLTVSPDAKMAFAFPDSTLVVAGALDVVKAALDRRGGTLSSIGAALSTKVGELSTSQDAWMVSLAPLSSLHGNRHAGAPHLPNGAPAETFQKVDQFSAGVKFGSDVVLTAQAVAQTAQDAASLAGVLQFLANLAQSQSGGDPNAVALAKSLTVSANGTTVNIGLKMPYKQFEGLIQPKKSVRRAPKTV